jgi:hypothetical protein
MAALHVQEVISLIETANNKGITISYSDDGLQLSFRKGTAIDPGFMDKLKYGKDSIADYLARLSINEFDTISEANSRNKVTKYERSSYYEITPTQCYWVNDSKDKQLKEHDEAHGLILIKYSISGNFDPLVFGRAVLAVAGVHESLRATFHKLGDKYMMRVEEDMEQYRMEFMDVRERLSQGLLTMEEVSGMADMRGRHFSFERGPLFMTCVIQTADMDYIVSIKLHHVISDTWSNEVLVQHLLDAYKNISREIKPYISPLKYQFGDFLGFFNTYREKYYNEHKCYWNSLYKTLPGELIIPEAALRIDRPQEKRVRRGFLVTFPEALSAALNVLTEKHNTTLFVVLQATVKAFLFHRTGQHDLLIGTNVSGRESPDSYDQIGSYARTDIIRTVLSGEDTFSMLIMKVKQSNADLVEKRAFSLMNAVEDMMGNDGRFEAFWKINVLYSDDSLIHASNSTAFRDLLNDLGLKISRLQDLSYTLIPIDMILDFINTKEELLIDVQYDSSLYEEAKLKSFFHDYLAYITEAVNHLYKPLKLIPDLKR